ncbi:MAG TPA: phosphorylase [Bacteroidales bacterium]|nr:phosphorylase [Bacteroidales bacterium]
MLKPNASELVLSADGSIYHLRIKPEQLADTVILVGDPGRVSMVSGHFDHLEFQGQNREMLVHTGWIGKSRITVISTGMGPDNIDIVVNELDALANIDLKTLEEKPNKTSLRLIRIGTSGSLQPDIPVNAFVAAEYAIGLDTLLRFYRFEGNSFEEEMVDEFIIQTEWKPELGRPYVVKASPELLNLVGKEVINGITATAPGFYGPQGRKLRLPLVMSDMNERLMKFRYHGRSITNFEMETSALYGLSTLMGHQALTICLTIANRASGTFSSDYHSRMNELIQFVLEKLTCS